PQPINRPHTRMTKPSAPQEGSQPASIQDELNLSAEAQKIGEISNVENSGEIRMDRVNQIRQQIADGTYETEEKLEAAIDRFLDLLG
ncbi:MAG: flagellar biosynthesis anti-sigma factor FlgM, partial [Planctomycetia bacterium]